jgi:putative transposase
MGVSRAQLSIRVHRLSDWQDRRRQSRFDDSAVLSRISTAVADLPTYGYRRIWAHKGRVAVAESNRRWCSDGFEFRCDNGEKLRVTFAQDCCDREIIDWAAGTGGYDKETV